MNCHLQAGDTGKLVVILSLKALELGARDINPSPTAREDEMRYPSSISKMGKRVIPPSFAFCSIQTFKDWIMLMHNGQGNLLY